MAQEKEAAQSASSAELSEMRRLLDASGIDLDKAAWRLHEEDEQKRRDAERVVLEQKEREAERKKTLDAAKALVESGNLIIKIDRKWLEHIDEAITVPCPSCGANLVEAAIVVRDIAGRAWRAGGDPYNFVVGGGRPPFHMNTYTCRNCQTVHSVSVQVVV